MKNFLNWLFSAQCILCRQTIPSKYLLCSDCYYSLPRVQAEKISLPTALELNISQVLFHYQTPIDYFIQQLKFHDQLKYAKFFGACFIEQLKLNAQRLPQALIPMPLHRQRLQQRGFNQAIEIAKPIAKHFKLPLLRDYCYRQKNTQPQSELSAHERPQNVRNAFAIKKSCSFQHVAIIDDVITTGSTVQALCQVLKNEGMSQIDVWCVAKVII